MKSKIIYIASLLLLFVVISDFFILAKSKAKIRILYKIENQNLNSKSGSKYKLETNVGKFGVSKSNFNQVNEEDSIILNKSTLLHKNICLTNSNHFKQYITIFGDPFIITALIMIAVTILVLLLFPKIINKVYDYECLTLSILIFIYYLFAQ